MKKCTICKESIRIGSVSRLSCGHIIVKIINELILLHFRFNFKIQFIVFSLHDNISFCCFNNDRAQKTVKIKFVC